VSKASNKRVIVPGISIWPQPKSNPRQRYKLTWTTGDRGDDGKLIRHTESASTDLQVTVEKARKIARRLERRRLGLSTAAEDRTEEQFGRPLAEHLEEWR